jgi:hypothetical protein
MRGVLLSLACLAAAGPVLAHDFWLQPRRFHMPAPGPAPTAILLGHGESRETWPIDTGRVVLMQTVGAAGVVDQRAAVRPGPTDIALTLSRPGTHVLAYEGRPTDSTLPGVRFTDYLKEEGLTLPLRARERSKTSNQPGRELYSRRAKALVRVAGPGAEQPQPQVTRPLGMTLEIVPERDPYTLRAGERLPVRVLYKGRPLPGALVKLTDLDADEKPLAMQRTNAAGRAVFTPPRRGALLLNVVWSEPASDVRQADYITVFSSLTFGYPLVAGRR